MHTGKKRGLTTASETVVALIILLLAMASVSGGFVGLAGLAESLAYAGVVAVPLLLVVFISNRMVEAQPEKLAVLAPIREKTASQN